MELQRLLENCLITNNQKRRINNGNDEVIKIEMEHFRALYDNGQTERFVGHQIPKFYHKVPNKEDILHQKLRDEARSEFLHRKSKQLPNNDELKELWTTLHRNHSGRNDEDILISYKTFYDLASVVGNKFKKYFRSAVFAKLLHGGGSCNAEGGRISASELFNYIMRSVWSRQTRIALSAYDETGQGFLKESDLECYIAELMPTLPQLGALEPTFDQFYVYTAVRKFMFFLDPTRTGRIRIQHIMASGFLDDVLQLTDESVPKEIQTRNWFSASSALRVYGDYLNLDKDHNGMLSKQELARYGTGTLSGVFLDSVFQECLTYGGEMDYRTYLDFVLALENRHEPQSLHYLFNILDVNHKAYLDSFDLNYFFKSMQDLMKRHGQEPVPFKDMQDEIFDMVKPAQLDRITFTDLLNSEKGDTVVTILIDLNGFWNHENREMMAAETATDHIK